MIAASRRPSGPVARLILLALFAAGCGATVPPIESSVPTPTRPPITPAPTIGKFVATAYPADGDAPCRQKGAPDASHGAYTGNLKRITAADARTVVFELCAPDIAFLAKIADPAFGINDTAWLTGHIDPGTTGAQPIATAINGTGPYRLEAWDRGAEISLARNDGYWGHRALNERLIVRWNPSSGERVGELQAGTVDGIDEVAPDGVEAIDADVSTVGAPRDGLDSVYLGFSNTVYPFGNEGVRRALALGIDRRALIGRYLPPGAQLSTHAAPCALPYACTGGSSSDFDAALAKETLAAAGYPTGFVTKIHYSTEPSAAIPDPGGLAAALQAQLETNLAITADLVAEPEATYRAAIDTGAMDGIHILEQGPGYPDVSASLDPRLATGARGEAGKPYDDIVKALATGRSTANGAKREAAYKKANDLIRAHVPLIPLAAVGSHAAFLADVTGGLASPLHQESFALMTPSDRRQLVWLTTHEPGGLYCADETDLVARLVCGQVVESLYTHEPGGAAVLPSLAEKCSPDAGLVTWTCTLRKDVLFGDGARLDANDVVLSMAVQWDAEHPLHLGRDGAFATFRSMFGGYLHPPPG
ncbi:MAG: ABC transporter substrate-binding protein [Chloroflexota bacterium]